MNLKDRVRQVLSSSHLMSLGTMDADGVWVADVLFVFDDELNIYWMSDPDSRHSRAILNNKKAAGTITFSVKGKEKNFGIQFEGTASKVDGARYELTVKLWAKRGRPAPPENEDVLKGDSWYMLKPSRFELIDEENFGFERQSVDLSRK